ncbi:hypothetical protein GK2287 [Geobacillus kaustophilus HTA426]|uniref:Uncharacterized protein n=1 Tax=Geobacillus kaustophilus (strain HTA426) TaxID=235909 RepID=Q5KXL4_GEOKA|nr:hypothetical protein GK2287 [Geobacillus kaustophilus HTA426]
MQGKCHQRAQRKRRSGSFRLSPLATAFFHHICPIEAYTCTKRGFGVQPVSAATFLRLRPVQPNRKGGTGDSSPLLKGGGSSPI